jgi:hypothetical protein
MAAARRTWTARISAAFAIWLVIVVVGYVFGNNPRPGLVALLVAAGAATVWLFLDVSDGYEPASWEMVDSERLRPLGEDPRLGLLERVVAQHLDSREVTEQLHRHLMQIADHRLVAHHGVSRLADPDRAAELMGPMLTDFASRTAPYPRIKPAQIDLLIDRIEAL